jgi:hypothetical protein
LARKAITGHYRGRTRQDAPTLYSIHVNQNTRTDLGPLDIKRLQASQAVREQHDAKHVNVVINFKYPRNRRRVSAAATTPLSRRVRRVGFIQAATDWRRRDSSRAPSSDDITAQLAHIPAAASPIDSRRHVLHRDSGENPD